MAWLDGPAILTGSSHLYSVQQDARLFDHQRPWPIGWPNEKPRQEKGWENVDICVTPTLISEKHEWSLLSGCAWIYSAKPLCCILRQALRACICRSSATTWTCSIITSSSMALPLCRTVCLCPCKLPRCVTRPIVIDTSDSDGFGAKKVWNTVPREVIPGVDKFPGQENLKIQSPDLKPCSLAPINLEENDKLILNSSNRLPALKPQLV